MARIKKIPCEFCPRRIDPRGMYAHRKLHNKESRTDPGHIYTGHNKKGRGHSLEQIGEEMNRMQTIIQMYNDLTVTAKEYIKSRLFFDGN